MIGLDQSASFQGRGGGRSSVGDCKMDQTEQPFVIFLCLIKKHVDLVESRGSLCASVGHFSDSLTYCLSYLVSVGWDFPLFCKRVLQPVVRYNSVIRVKGHFRVHSQREEREREMREREKGEGKTERGKREGEERERERRGGNRERKERERERYERLALY